MAWKKGPLPPGTQGWGGVVPTEEAMVERGIKLSIQGGGFLFATFLGDHVKLAVYTSQLRPDEVAWYDNGIHAPDLQSDNVPSDLGLPLPWKADDAYGPVVRDGEDRILARVTTNDLADLIAADHNAMFEYKPKAAPSDPGDLGNCGPSDPNWYPGQK